MQVTERPRGFDFAMPTRSGPNNLEKLRLKRSNSKVEGTPMAKTSARLKRLKPNVPLGPRYGQGARSTPRKSAKKQTPSSRGSRKSSASARPREYFYFRLS